MGCSSSQPEAPRQPTTPQHKYTNDLARARWRRAIRLVIASNNFKKAGFERRLRAGQEADLSDPTKEKPQRQSSRLDMQAKVKERRLSEAKAEDARLEQVRLDDLGAKIDAIAGACGASVERLHGGSAVGGGDAISRTAEDNRERCRQQLRAVVFEDNDTLNLACLGLGECPAGLPALVGGKVTRLELRGNQLQRLPDSIGEMRGLVELGLVGNAITAKGLPASLGALQDSLERVFLARNQLGELPLVLCRLPKLQVLGLEDNQLTKLPAALFDPGSATIALKQIDLSGNEITEPPPEVMQQGVAAARAYFDSKLDAAGSVYA